MHLGVQIRGHRLPDNTGKLMWGMSAEKCLNEVLHKLDTILLKKGKYLPTKVVKPLFNNYCPNFSDYSSTTILCGTGINEPV